MYNLLHEEKWMKWSKSLQSNACLVFLNLLFLIISDPHLDNLAHTFAIDAGVIFVDGQTFISFLPTVYSRFKEEASRVCIWILATGS